MPYSCLLVLTTSLLTAVYGYSLAGKRALVTGSSGGIGRGIALELARQGCQVLIHYHTREQLAHETAALIAAETETASSVAGVLQCDFRDVAAMKRFQCQVDAIWPDGFDVLVNNAGIVGKLALEDDDPGNNLSSHWHEVMAVNLHAPRWLSHWAVPLMKERGGGVILMVSSVHGENSNEYMGAYAASKAALNSLTKTMAVEYAKHRRNIRVNAIAPGIVVVERTAETLADRNNAQTQAWLDKCLVNRLGRVEDVAQAALLLLTQDWVTGTIWNVDGGIMARSNMPPRERPLKEGGVC